MAAIDRLVTDDLLPVPRHSQSALPQTSLHGQVVAIRSDALLHQEQLTRDGSRVVSNIFKFNQREFSDATGEALAIVSEAKSADHQEIVAKFFNASYPELATGLIEIGRLSEAQVKTVIAAGFALNPPSPPSLQPKPKRQVIEERNLTLSERLSGRAWFVHEE